MWIEILSKTHYQAKTLLDIYLHRQLRSVVKKLKKNSNETTGSVETSTPQETKEIIGSKTKKKVEHKKVLYGTSNKDETTYLASDIFTDKKEKKGMSETAGDHLKQN